MYIMLKHLYFILSFSRRITFSGVLNSITNVLTWEGWYTFQDLERDNSIILISFLKKNWTRIGFVIKLWDFTKSSYSQWCNGSPLYRAGIQLPAQWLHCIDFFYMVSMALLLFLDACRRSFPFSLPFAGSLVLSLLLVDLPSWICPSDCLFIFSLVNCQFLGREFLEVFRIVCTGTWRRCWEEETVFVLFVIGRSEQEATVGFFLFHLFLACFWEQVYLKVSAA